MRGTAPMQQPRAWLWGRQLDLFAFGGSAALALLAVLWARYAGVAQSGLFPEWAFFVFVLLIDVAHVYATLFRTYVDHDEVRRHRARYYGVPIGAFLVLWLVHTWSAAWFWTLLAYTAVFHFIRQQAGWAALYRIAARQGKVDRTIDNLAVYLATGYPVVFWHAHLAERRFVWFVPGDFMAFTWPEWLVQGVALAWAVALLVYVARQILISRSGGGILWGKNVLVGTTAVCWFVGIVATNSDFEFTATNVMIHGIPYVVLLWRYHSARHPIALEPQGSRPGFSPAASVWTFLGVLLGAAVVEEWLWDRLVYHERPWFLGSVFEVELSAFWLHVCVALLALPQATHYVLDGLLWKRRDALVLPALRQALGLATESDPEEKHGRV